MEPFGRLVGEVPFQWTDQELTLKPALTPRSGSLAGKFSCSAGGSLSGGVTWERAEIDFAGGLLSAGRSGGKVELKSETPGVLAEVTAGLEEVSLRVDRLPRGDLSLGDGEKLSFEKGSILATLTAEGLNPFTLVLRGEGCGLRLLGNVGRRGDLDAIMVVAVGEEARAINALPFPSPPSRWRAAVGDRALPLRLRGDSRACQARRVEWSDPSFRS
jgi:hypothetical protein